jgi:hypothetical protein
VDLVARRTSSPGTGFGVRPADLAAGSSQVVRQQQRCAQVSAVVVEVIAQMAGAVGYEALASELIGVSESATQAFLVTGGLYDYVAQNLRQSANTYDQAEQATLTSVQAISRKL